MSAVPWPVYGAAGTLVALAGLAWGMAPVWVPALAVRRAAGRRETGIAEVPAHPSDREAT